MMATMRVDIVSAEEEIFSGEAEMVVAPAEMGEVGIMPRHTPLITRLRPGEVRLQTSGQEDQFYFVSGGILEVQPHVVTVLSDTALRAKDLDEAQAHEAKQRAEEMLADKQADIDFAKVQAELAEAVAQLRMLERLRKRR
ncbi:MAG: F0F1 ATP synthase subunit epsilon [Pseudomonadota bacterium]|nr:F0F1 ATP synthase subunit epsilon [Pseudomonadota bacterium]